MIITEWIFNKPNWTSACIRNHVLAAWLRSALHSGVSCQQVFKFHNLTVQTHSEKYIGSACSFYGGPPLVTGKLASHYLVFHQAIKFLNHICKVEFPPQLSGKVHAWPNKPPSFEFNYIGKDCSLCGLICVMCMHLISFTGWFPIIFGISLVCAKSDRCFLGFKSQLSDCHGQCDAPKV